MTSPLNLTARAKEAATTGFTLKSAIGEALGFASMCWDRAPVSEFDAASALLVADDLHQAIAEFLRGAINAQSIDADMMMSDREVVEIIGQDPSMGYKVMEAGNGGHITKIEGEQQ